MNVGSLFSGIGGLDLGLARAGFQHAFLCESDPWRRTVLAHHFPGVPIYEDVCLVGERETRAQADGSGSGSLIGGREAGAGLPVRGDLGLLCGGFPCQDVSVAGRRAGLAGQRSGLFYEFARIAESLRPRWILVENVPGLLSSNGGRDFGAVLGTLADIGYGVAWRILDSRYFGVPQRRRRVFVLGTLADGDPRGAAERAGEILAVGTRCERHPAAGTEARKDVALASLSGLGSGGPDDNDGQGGRLVAASLTGGNTAHGPRGGASRLDDHDVHGNHLITHALTSEGHDAGEDGTGRGTPLIAAPLSHGSNPNSNMAGRRREDDENLVYGFNTGRGGNADDCTTEGQTPPITGRHGDPGGVFGAAVGVRRLTPTECERLQALPDGWTDFGPDSRRYAALGDAVTASVGEWIGAQLMAHLQVRSGNSEASDARGSTSLSAEAGAIQ